jgi:hypothetical protein
MALPALRNVDIVPIRHENRDLFCMRDPEGYIEEQLLLSPLACFISSCLDGKSDIVDVQETFARHASGKLLMSDDIMKVVACLETQGFLCTKTFEQIRSRVVGDFLRQPVREAYLAGKSYYDAPEELRDYLDDLLAAQAAIDDCSARPLGGAIVPHIDFERGREAYARAYGRLACMEPPETVFIFGVAHNGARSPFILTKKAFDTPFGPLAAGESCIDRMAEACAWNAYEDEYLHRTEHSIEFQAVMLAHLFGPGIKIVPVLCGLFCQDLDRIEQPPGPEVERFLDACAGIYKESGGKMMVIAGGDLAHVGRRFGDDFDIDDDITAKIERIDRADLAHALKLDAEAFYRGVMSGGNPRKVCGGGCIYSALRTMGEAVDCGELVHYGSAPDPAGGIVSFAGIVFPRKSSMDKHGRTRTAKRTEQ